MERESRLRSICYILAIILFSGVILYFASRYLFSALLPFLFAWGIAISLKRPIEFVSHRGKIPYKAAAISVILVLFFVVGYLFFLFFSSFASQLHGIYEKIAGNSRGLERALEGMLEEFEVLMEKIPIINRAGRISLSAQGRVLSIFGDMGERLLPHIASFIGKLVSGIPYIAFFLLVSAISVFYFSCELYKINFAVASFFSPPVREFLFLVKREFFSVTFGYFRAYSLIMLLTFFEVFAGLSVIGVEYALVISVFIAIVDILPILGAGAVLIPWGAFLVFFGDTARGASILVLYLVITILRQLLEPKIVGNVMGLHPLLMLLSLYAGGRLFGFWGIIFLPIIIIVAKNVYSEIYSRE